LRTADLRCGWIVIIRITVGVPHLFPCRENDMIVSGGICSPVMGCVLAAGIFIGV